MITFPKQLSATDSAEETEVPHIMCSLPQRPKANVA
jgi:hypothetical protein